MNCRDMKKSLREYDIQVYKLSNKTHEYTYQITDAFFENFENTLIEKGSLVSDLILEKTPNLINIHFSIKGEVELTCDRSLEKFNHPIDVKTKLLFKYAEEYEELSDEIITVPHDIQQLNVAQYIYEFIGIQVPMKKLHPKFQNEETEGDIVIYQTNAEEEEKKDEVDPRWAALNKLK